MLWKHFKLHNFTFIVFYSKEEADVIAKKVPNKTSMFYIAVGTIFGLLLLIATAVCYLHVRSMPKEEDEALLSNQM